MKDIINLEVKLTLRICRWTENFKKMDMTTGELLLGARNKDRPMTKPLICPLKKPYFSLVIGDVLTRFYL